MRWNTRVARRLGGAACVCGRGGRFGLGLVAGSLCPLQEMFGNFGHVWIPSLQRPGDAAVLADSPEVNGHEDDRDEWEE